MCLSLIILLLTDLTFSITNFGSGFPEPNGAKQFTFLKKSTFRAVGAMTLSKDKIFPLLIFPSIFLNFKYKFFKLFYIFNIYRKTGSHFMSSTFY